jgi:hypothetical protein
VIARKGTGWGCVNLCRAVATTAGNARPSIGAVINVGTNSPLEDSGRSCSVDQDVVECPCQRIGVVECPTIEIATADCPRYTWGKVKATSKNGGPQLSPLPFSAFTPLA